MFMSVSHTRHCLDWSNYTQDRSVLLRRPLRAPFPSRHGQRESKRPGSHRKAFLSSRPLRLGLCLDLQEHLAPSTLPSPFMGNENVLNLDPEERNVLVLPRNLLHFKYIKITFTWFKKNGFQPKRYKHGSENFSGTLTHTYTEPVKSFLLIGYFY